MPPLHLPPTAPADSPARLTAGWGRHAAAAALACAGIGCGGLAQAQMVPRAEHMLRQGHAGVATAHVAWRATPLPSLLAPGRGAGVALRDVADAASPWARWGGRVGVALDRPLNPLHDSYVLAQPIDAGLRLRAMHLLSDHSLGHGFRATLGLVSGQVGHGWWASQGQGGGLNLSLQHIDSLGLDAGRQTGRRNGLGLNLPSAYVGAGYTLQVDSSGTAALPGQWQFNADVGFVGERAAIGSRLGATLQGQGLLSGLRPLVKLSLGVAF